MLVVAGRPVELSAHMARLAASLEALFGGETPAGAGDLVRERARGVELGRLRLTVAPDGAGGLAAEARAAAVEPGLVFPPPERTVALRSLVVEGGLGAHKWADRALLERAEAAEGAVPLLRDGDGAVLEASRSNVFLVRGGALATPPADRRILPGIARMRAMQVARGQGLEVRETEVSLDDLRRADEVFLTGSVRGIEPVRSLDGAELDGAALEPRGDVTARLAMELRRRWLG